MLAARPQPDFHKIKPGERLAVAVSGGSDSLALLLLAKEFCSKDRRDLVSVTFDHGLRPDSASEAQWVVEKCRSLGIDAHVLTWFGDKPQSGVQAKARSARYAALTQWCNDNGYPVLLTAHTRDDQAETVAMRSRRSMAPRSLAAIWPENYINGVRVIRPLLSVSKSVLRDYLISCGELWLEDPSNANPVFERVRIRQTLLSSQIDELAAMAEVSQNTVIEARGAAQAWFMQNVTIHPEGYFSFLRSSIGPLRAVVLEHGLRCMFFALSGQRPKTTDGLARIVSWLRIPGAARTTVSGVILAKRSREVFIMREPARMEAHEAVVPDGGLLLWDHRFHVSAPPGTVVRAAGRGPSKSKHPSVALVSLPVGQDRVEIHVEFVPNLDFG